MLRTEALVQAALGVVAAPFSDEHCLIMPAEAPINALRALARLVSLLFEVLLLLFEHLHGLKILIPVRLTLS